MSEKGRQEIRQHQKCQIRSMSQKELQQKERL